MQAKKQTPAQNIPELIREAKISDCAKYRFSLKRIWDKDNSLVLFIMLNPSTADANTDDPTIRRCIGYAKYWGYGGIMIGNLSPYRATNPKELKSIPYNSDIDYQNEQEITNMYWQACITVFAWGNPPCELPACPLIEREKTYYLALTKQGNPKHPLYLRGDLQPIKYEQKLYSYAQKLQTILRHLQHTWL